MVEGRWIGDGANKGPKRTVITGPVNSRSSRDSEKSKQVLTLYLGPGIRFPIERQTLWHVQVLDVVR